MFNYSYTKAHATKPVLLAPFEKESFVHNAMDPVKLANPRLLLVHLVHQANFY
jgi:hypothetical protein